jgi:serine/threonine protein kinase/formylglycine-generating enzyme required for sulfatase activity
MAAADSPLDAFLAAIWRDYEAGNVRPLAEYLARFPGDDAAVEHEYREIAGTSTVAGRAAGGGETTAILAHPGEPSTALRRVGPYRLLRELGRGGQGEVYLARDVRMNRDVALKVMTRRNALDPVALERFRREALVASKLDHPGVCTVYDVGQDRGAPYLAMRYVPGEPLSQSIASARARLGAESGGGRSSRGRTAAEGPSTPAERGAPPRSPEEIRRVVGLIERTARALHAAHEAGVVHRDVKPGNVMVTPDDEPVLLDFGLAADQSDGDATTLSRTGDLLGTPAYMSPEQLDGRKTPLDRRTDVWSLGVTLYEALTLRRPFEAPTRDALYRAILEQEPPDPRTLNPALSRDLCAVLATATEKDRGRRYATALDLAEELRRVRAYEPVVARPAGPLTKLRRFAQRNPALAAALVGLFAILVAGLATTLVLLRARGDALTAKSAALSAATSDRAARDAALADYERLGDQSRLESLVAEADRLWPAAPERVDDYRRWLADADRLAANLPLHAAALNALRAASDPADDVRTEAERSTSRPAYRFRDAALQFKHDTTATLVRRLETFLDPDPFAGAVASVRKRLRVAETVDAATRGRHAAAWDAACRAVADPAGRYGGLALRPQRGLIPLGADPRSRLQEFLHYESTADDVRDGPPPARGKDGALALDERAGVVFVLIPGGSFDMGARRPTPDEADDAANGDGLPPNVDPAAERNETPVHRATAAPFFLAKHELTQAQWKRIAGTSPSQSIPGRIHFGRTVTELSPATNVSWEDAAGPQGALKRLGLDLPTETQWEYACRAGTTTPWWTGARKETLSVAENLGDAFARRNGAPSTWKFEAWSDGYGAQAPVGSLVANGFGLHDTAGNVMEWCRDRYAPYAAPASRPEDGPGRPSGAPRARTTHLIRGGSFSNDASLARSSNRTHEAPDFTSSFLGVRPARAVDAP